jgi:hypothetical protein
MRISEKKFLKEINVLVKKKRDNKCSCQKKKEINAINFLIILNGGSTVLN